MPAPAHSLPPGSTIGILGGGQLGRMLALAAARLGLKAHIYSDEAGPAFDVAASTTVGDYLDRAALERFARRIDVVTYEFENVPVDAAEYLATLVPVRPGARALAVAQDRLEEKIFISGLDIAVAPYERIDSEHDLARALAGAMNAGILKTRRLGYDGKGQVSLAPDAGAAAAWREIGGKPAVLERRIAFAGEVSVLIVRAVGGETVVYDIPENTHAGGILRRSVVPAHLPGDVREQAHAIARRIAGALDYVGVLAVELFHVADGSRPVLVVNEIAPRVHNSGHWTIDACAVSQFENHIRAVAGWTLGDAARHSDAVMVNLIGSEANDWARLAAEPGLALHLYGKREPREGRKMGHYTRLLPLTRP